MASFTEISRYIDSKVLPCVRKRVPEACMATKCIRGTDLLEVSFYTKMPEIFGSTEIPFFSTGRQKLIEDLVSAMVRKNPGMKITPILSGFLIAYD